MEHGKREMTMNRGESFEKSLSKADYFNEAYFDIRQLMAQMMQIKLIYSMKPKSMFEIGIGNGLTSSFIRSSGIEVLTADINPNLGPDICCPISEVPDKLAGRKFDVVVCCEVLEHMPLEELDRNIEILSAIGNRLFLTLPEYTQSFGLSGVFKLPRVPAKDFFFHLFVRKRIDLKGTEHFWEVGSEGSSKRNAIVERLKKHFGSVKTGRISFQPNQIYFIAE